MGESLKKASIIIELRGGKLLRNNRPNKINFKVVVRNKKGKLVVVRQGATKHHFLYPSSCSKRIDISLQAWNYMTSDECVLTKNWKSLTPKQRFEKHCEDMCQDCNGIGYSYELYF